jgi:NitT/TauT family transport system substrate-binding protein/sulfonate transport system substrate-binding protein
MIRSETRRRDPGRPAHRATGGRLAALGAALAASALALTACGAAAGAQGSSGDAAGDPKGFTLRIGLVTKVGADGVFGWADNQKILAKDLAPVGVTKVVFSTFASGPPLNAALEAGSVDVAEMGDTPALELRATGFASRNIAISGINSNFYLLGKKGGPTTLAGLAGRKVTAPTGTAPAQYLTQLLAEQSLSDTVHISNLQTNDAATALQAGSIDAFVDSGPNAIALIQKGYPVIDQAGQHPDLETTSENIASQKFLNAHPGFAAAWGQALTDAAASARADSAGYWAFNAQVEKVSVSIATQANPRNGLPDSPFSSTGIQQLTNSYNFLRQHGDLKAPFDLTAWLDRS